MRSEHLSLLQKALIAADVGMQVTPGLNTLRSGRKVPGAMALAMKYGGVYGKIAAAGAFADKHLEQAADNIRKEHAQHVSNLDSRPDLSSQEPNWDEPLNIEGNSPDLHIENDTL